MRSPAFSFYVRDWLCSKTVNRLHSAAIPNPYETPTNTTNLRSRGVAAYVFLLCQAWLEDPPATLPNDDDELAAMARISRAEWDAIKPILMPALKLDANSGRLYSERQMEELIKQKTRSLANTKNVRTRYEHATNPTRTLENENENGTKVEGGVGGNGELDFLLAEVCKAYKRPSSIIRNYDEEQAASEIAVRPEMRSELQLLIQQKEREPEYFPKSVLSLFKKWDSTLDTARAWQPKENAI